MGTETHPESMCEGQHLGSCWTVHQAVLLIGLRKLRVKNEVKRKERHFGHMWGKKKDAYNEILLCVCRMMGDGKPLLLPHPV